MTVTVMLKSHGGGCCGIRHITGFGNRFYNFNQNFDDNAKFIRDTIASKNKVKGKLFEIVLNTEQMQNTRLLTFLKETGFRMVSRFNNNTGSICHVFHYHLNPLPLI